MKVDINLKNLKVKFLNIMDLGVEEEEVMFLDDLFLKTLFMNDMGFEDGHRTEYMIKQMIAAAPEAINMIDSAYKLDLINSWDYYIEDIINEDNVSVKNYFEEYTSKGALNINDKDIFKIILELNKNSNIDSEDRDYVYLALLAMMKYGAVYNVFNSNIKKIIEDLIEHSKYIVEEQLDEDIDNEAMKVEDLKPGDIVIFKRYCEILKKEDYQDGNVIKVYPEDKRVDILWLEGYKSMLDSVNFNNVIAKHDKDGAYMKFGVYSGKSILLKS